MKTLYRLSLPLLWVLLLLSACGAPDSSAQSNVAAARRVYIAPPSVADYKLFSDQQDHFQITYPDSWLVVQTADLTAKVVFINPSPNGAKPDQAAASVILQDPAANLDTAANSAEQELIAQGAKNFKLLSQRPVDVNTVSGIERTVSYEVQGYPLTSRTVYLTNATHTYVLSLTTPSGNADRFNVVFDHIISSFVVS